MAIVSSAMAKVNCGMAIVKIVTTRVDCGMYLVYLRQVGPDCLVQIVVSLTPVCQERSYLQPTNSESFVLFSFVNSKLTI